MAIMKRIHSSLIMGFVAVLFAVPLLLVLQWPVGTVVGHWDQPPHIKYGSFEPYTVYVIDESSWWNIANRKRFSRVGICSSVHGGPDYGHYTDYTFHNYSSEDDYFTQCSAEWTPEGVAILEPTGHKLFIPKSAFIGGR